MLNWGYAWSLFQDAQEGEETQVAGKVGVAPLPAFDDNASATCVGGFQWAMNPFSDNKDEAFQVMQHMASYDSQKELAIAASHIPARDALYEDEDVLAAAPQFGQFFDVIQNARPRPSDALLRRSFGADSHQHERFFRPRSRRRHDALTDAVGADRYPRAVDGRVRTL